MTLPSHDTGGPNNRAWQQNEILHGLIFGKPAGGADRVSQYDGVSLGGEITGRSPRLSQTLTLPARWLIT
jgi:hypothetical protein